MATVVLYTPENRGLDLARLNQTDYELIRSLHRRIKRGQRILLCQKASAKPEDREMLVKERNGRYRAAHFPGGGHDCSYVIARESDEHRRQKDYWARAAEYAGFEVTRELPTGRGTILDVAIHGLRDTGIELRHSAIATPAVKARTTRSFNAGWLSVWFLDSDRQPDWMHHVPAVRSNIGWEQLPPRRSATAIGLSRFLPAKCRPGAFDRCPEGRRRPCGEWHPQRQPWGGLTIDDVAAMVPARRIVPLYDLHGDVHLAAPEALDLFRELTDRPAEYRPDLRGKTRSATHRTRCRHPVHDNPPVAAYCTGCGQGIFHLAQLVRPDPNLCDGCRKKRRLPAPALRP